MHNSTKQQKFFHTTHPPYVETKPCCLFSCTTAYHHRQQSTVAAHCIHLSNHCMNHTHTCTPHYTYLHIYYHFGTPFAVNRPLCTSVYLCPPFYADCAEPSIHTPFFQTPSSMVPSALVRLPLPSKKPLTNSPSQVTPLDSLSVPRPFMILPL